MRPTRVSTVLNARNGSRSCCMGRTTSALALDTCQAFLPRYARKRVSWRQLSWSLGCCWGFRRPQSDLAIYIALWSRFWQSKTAENSYAKMSYTVLGVYDFQMLLSDASLIPYVKKPWPGLFCRSSWASLGTLISSHLVCCKGSRETNSSCGLNLPAWLLLFDMRYNTTR